MGSGVFMKKSELASYLGLTDCGDCQVALRRILSNNFSLSMGVDVELPEWACKALLGMVEEEKPLFDSILGDRDRFYDELGRWRMDKNL